MVDGSLCFASSRNEPEDALFDALTIIEWVFERGKYQVKEEVGWKLTSWLIQLFSMTGFSIV